MKHPYFIIILVLVAIKRVDVFTVAMLNIIKKL